MPAPTGQHSRTATGWPYQVRMMNASNTPCEATITNGSRRLLSSKPKPIDLRMKPWSSCMKRSSNSAARRAEPQNELNPRSEEHTSELQSRGHLVCRLLLEKKNTLLGKKK